MKKKITKVVKIKAKKKVKLSDVVGTKFLTNTQFFNQIQALVEERKKSDTRSEEVRNADTELIIAISNAQDNPIEETTNVRNLLQVQASSSTFNHFIEHLIETSLEQKVKSGKASAVDQLLMKLLKDK